MALNEAKNIRIDAAPSVGAVALAPLATTLPVDCITALAVAYKVVGILGNEGVDMKPAVSSKDVEDMNGNVVATIETGYKTEFTFHMLETNLISLGLFNDTVNVTTVVGAAQAPDVATVKGGAPVFEHNVVVITTVSNTLRSRIVIPDAKVIGRDAVKVSGTLATERVVTLIAYPFDPQGHTYISYTEIPK